MARACGAHLPRGCRRANSNPAPRSVSRMILTTSKRNYLINAYAITNRRFWTCILHPGSWFSSNALTMIDPSLRLRRAIHSRSTILVKRILTTHPHLLQNADFTSPNLSNTSLHLAASLGCEEIVNLLLSLGHESAGISLNEDHQTPLMLASAAGHTDTVHILCSQCPSSISKRDIRGMDAIMEAARGGHDTCIQLLLTFAPEGQAILDNVDIDGNTALHFGSSNGNLKVLRTLLAAGADPSRRNAWSWTPVSYSATVNAEVYFGKMIEEEGRKRGRLQEVVEAGKSGIRVVVGEDL